MEADMATVSGEVTLLLTQSPAGGRVMDDGELKTHLWNLAFGVTCSLALAACGPSVSPEGETDTASATETDPGETETEGETNTDTTPGQCIDASDCQPDEDCIDGVCVPYEDYCDDGCCFPECYYECYSDADCGPMGVCQPDYGGCAYPQELPECDTLPLAFPIPLPPAPGNFVSMAFVDANGDAAQDLVISRDEGTELYLGGSEPTPPVLLPLDPGVFAHETAAGDFDGDGDADLVFSVPPASLVLATGNGDGSFALAQSLAVGFSPVELVPLQWNGEGELELVTLDTQGNAALRRTEGGVFMLSEPLVGSGEEILSLVGFDYEGDAFGDLVAQGQATADVYVGNEANDVTPDFGLPGPAHGPRRLWSARMGPQPEDALVGLTQREGWVLLELWASGTENPQLYALVDDGYDARVGDLDGDGVDDLLTWSAMGLIQGLSFVRGSNDGQPSFECRIPYYFGDPPGAFSYELGDFDGNGRADVVIEIDGVVTIGLTQ
jgi:hypothetical protein